MSKPRLHLDADSSRRTLQKMLRQRGHDVTRTPNEWMPLDANDETQLLRATAYGRILFTFNIVDFQLLARRYPQHAGVLLAQQRQWTHSGLIKALDKMLTETEMEEWQGQVRWLNQWRNQE
ncbi:MAG TPA: hypothetical protein EYP41_07920 [Anaerolineae bacterium]|nr:hypothetical protein [Anaerolineae bacterium]HIP70543.1 hypothetical protein [Anaerolineae bacterium]